MIKYNNSSMLKVLNLVFIFLFFFCSIPFLSAQENTAKVYQYARKIVDTMASQSMYGRGYVNEGDRIAASYLRQEFQKNGLQPFTESGYYQHFSFPINTFPGKISVKIDGKELMPGKDFIVSPRSPSSTGEHAVVMADEALVLKKKQFKKFLKQDFSNKIIVVNDTGQQTKELHELLGNSCKAAAVVALKDKLTWRASQEVADFPVIEILRSSFTDPQEIEFTIENKFIADHQSQNVIAYVKGTEFPDSIIVFSAHYDHLGQMGKEAYFPGANDNASGCAMLLNLAKHYSMPENKPEYSIVFIAFAGEEVGLLGSKHFTGYPLFPLKNIRFVLNMDIMGTGEEGITAVNGSVFNEEFDNLVKINTENIFIKDVKIRGKAANSDHYFFSEKGVKAFFIYTMGGTKAYHDIYDIAETLPLNEFENLFKLILKFSEYLQN